MEGTGTFDALSLGCTDMQRIVKADAALLKLTEGRGTGALTAISLEVADQPARG